MEVAPGREGEWRRPKHFRSNNKVWVREQEKSVEVGETGCNGQ